MGKGEREEQAYACPLHEVDAWNMANEEAVDLTSIYDTPIRDGWYVIEASLPQHCPVCEGDRRMVYASPHRPHVGYLGPCPLCTGLGRLPFERPHTQTPKGAA